MKILNVLLVIVAISSCTDKYEVEKRSKSESDNDLKLDKVASLSTPVTNSFTYLALGDSYTVGQGITRIESYPYQLIYRLRNSTEGLAPRVVAKTGWTSGELLEGIKAANITSTFDMVTLLIGVNNQYRGYSKEVFRSELVQLLDLSIKFAKGHKAHVFVLSIPDWGVTPYGKPYNQDLKISNDIDAFNRIVKAEARRMGIPYINITDLSRLAGSNTSYVATDRLHYSASMYKLWVDRMVPIIQTYYRP